MKKLAIMITAVCALMCNVVMAQRDPATLSFIKNATIANTKEIKAGELAVRKGRSQQVKSFGRQMITDHTMAGDKLKAIARRKGYVTFSPPANMVAPDPMLTRTMGPEFDRNYITMMVQDHKMAVALFERASRESREPAIREFAQQTLPTLRHHLMMIQDIAKTEHVRM